jgi:hypothetical protein
MLHSTLAPASSVTAYQVASSATTLRLAAVWWPAGFILAASYSP